MSKTDFTLQYPVELPNKAAVTVLSLRRPKMRDIKLLESGNQPLGAKVMLMIANCAEVEPTVIDELDPVDFEKISAWLEPILDPKGQGSGGAGS